MIVGRGAGVKVNTGRRVAVGADGGLVAMGPGGLVEVGWGNTGGPPVGYTVPLGTGVMGRRVGDGVGVTVGEPVGVGVSGVGVRLGEGETVGEGVSVEVGVGVLVGGTSTTGALCRNPWLSEAITLCTPAVAQEAQTVTSV